jgi:hypothetical protein
MEKKELKSAKHDNSDDDNTDDDDDGEGDDDSSDDEGGSHQRSINNDYDGNEEKSPLGAPHVVLGSIITPSSVVVVGCFTNHPSTHFINYH